MDPLKFFDGLLGRQDEVVRDGVFESVDLALELDEAGRDVASLGAEFFHDPFHGLATFA